MRHPNFVLFFYVISSAVKPLFKVCLFFTEMGQQKGNSENLKCKDKKNSVLNPKFSFYSVPVLQNF